MRARSLSGLAHVGQQAAGTQLVWSARGSIHRHHDIALCFAGAGRPGQRCVADSRLRPRFWARMLLYGYVPLKNVALRYRPGPF